MKLPVVLASRWGLDPVIVVPSSSSDGGESLCPSAETRNTSVKRCPKPTPPAPAPEAAEAAGGSPFSIISRDDGRDGAGNDDDDEDYIDDEPTGRVLWDCAQVLWDLVADPNPANVFSVKGKVRVMMCVYAAVSSVPSSLLVLHCVWLVFTVRFASKRRRLDLRCAW